MNSRRFAMRRPAALLLALWAGPAACFAPSARGVLSLTGPSLRPAPCPARPAGAACGMVPAHAGSGPSRQQRARAAAVRSCAAASSPPMVGACMHDVMRSHAHTHSCASGGTLKPAASQRQVAGPALRGIRSVLGRLVVQMAVIAAAVFAFAPMQAHAKVCLPARLASRTHASTHPRTHARSSTREPHQAHTNTHVLVSCTPRSPPAVSLFACVLYLQWEHTGLCVVKTPGRAPTQL